MEEQLKDVKKLEKQRSELLAKLNMINEKRDTVKSQVYEKVKQEYEAKLAQLNNQLMQKKDVIETELKTAEKSKKTFVTEKEQLDMDLEELELRYSIGEFDDATFKKLEKEKRHKLVELEKNLKSIDDRVTWMKDLMAGKVSETTIAEPIETEVAETKEPEPVTEPEAEPAVEETPVAEEEAVVQEKLEPMFETKQEPTVEVEKEAPVVEETAKATEETKDASFGVEDFFKELTTEAKKPEPKEEIPVAGEKPKEEEKKDDFEIEEHIFSKKEAFREPPKKIVCPKCGFSNNPDSWYCEKCGAEILQESDK